VQSKTRSTTRSTTRSVVLVFLAAAALLLLLHGNRFVLTNDEGILLEPARQMAAGERPYVDFFGYMSPGSYWLQAALFRMLGVSLWVARIPVIFGLSLQCALVFWLTARLASCRAALAAVLVFFGFQIADPSFLTAQHRWDSSSLAMAGLCLAVVFADRQRMWMLGASGALLAAAAWCTPSVALAGIAQAVWLVAARERRKALIPFTAGVLAVTAAAVAWLALTGTLSAFLHQMLWLQRNYGEVNVMPYGSVMGGYSRLLADAAGVEKFLRLVFVTCLALPAVLPPLAALLWAFLFWRKKAPPESKTAIQLLLLATAAMVASTFPRADLFHLGFVAALPYVLAAAALGQLLSLRAGAIVAFTMIPLAALFALNNVTGSWSARVVASPVGTIRVAPNLAPDVEKLLAEVHPAQTLFVYPYSPIQYFITQARNPTRFSYLAAGMMTGQEEAAALAQLQSQPPRWLLYLPLGREEFLRVFPHATTLSGHFETLETWLTQNYRPLQQPAVNLGGYRLWQRVKEPPDALTLRLR
jgi:4-amino-4-deoxy-L-arabinose transferase-like glycosyltransferase